MHNESRAELPAILAEDETAATVETFSIYRRLGTDLEYVTTVALADADYFWRRYANALQLAIDGGEVTESGTYLVLLDKDDPDRDVTGRALTVTTNPRIEGTH